MRLASTIVLALIALLPAFGYTSRTEEALNALDRSLRFRGRYIAERQAKIDSIRKLIEPDAPDLNRILELANLYRGFDNDSALHYLSQGLEKGDARLTPRFLWKRAALLPLAGMFEDAERTFAQVDSSSLAGPDLVSYLEAGRQMHRYCADFYVRNPELHAQHIRESLRFQERNLAAMNDEDPWYKYNLAEFYASTGRNPMAKVLFQELLDHESDLSLRARTAHHLARISKAEDNEDDYIYYLALSADADARSATREVLSLQELGALLENSGNTERAYNYLSNALRNAVECGAPVRMIDSATSLPLIEEAHTRKVKETQMATYVALGIFIIMTLVLVGMTVALRLRMGRMRRLQMRLRRESDAREIYISRFLELCSIYMDKLNQFCKIANRKLAAGQAEDLYRLTKSGKFVEEQSADFFDVFDSMFLHIYPDFLRQVNELLRENATIELKEGEKMNTDLRILAFMRLGIQESGRIAQMLNYSLNTIYSYRNRLKSRAKDKDNFENAVMKIPPAI